MILVSGSYRITSRRIKGRQAGETQLSLPDIRILLQRNRCDRAAVRRLLAVAGVASVRGGHPRLIVTELKNLRTKFAAESATNTGIDVYFRRGHNFLSFLQRDLNGRTAFAQK